MDDDTEAKIRKRAFLIWESGGQHHGQHDDHWEQASKEIAAEITADAATEMPGSGAAPTVDKTTDAKPPKVTKTTTITTKTAKTAKA